MLVARQGQTTYDELNKAIDSLRFAKANVVSVVLTGVREETKLNSSVGAYKSYDYEYGKG